jgi:hypothetical protein
LRIDWTASEVQSIPASGFASRPRLLRLSRPLDRLHRSASPPRPGFHRVCCQRVVGTCDPSTFPYRSGLPCSNGQWPAQQVLRPLLTSAVLFGTPYDAPSPSQDARQISRGKFNCLPRTTAEFTLCVLDGCGLCESLPARPTLTPLIRFLYIGPRVCLRLLSDPASRRRPCPWPILHLHQVG